MSDLQNKNELLKIAINASLEAGKAIMHVYNRSDFGTTFKADKSPLTEADTVAGSIINDAIHKTGIPIINEEIKNETYQIRKNWKTCWIVDPLDGTKEFLKRNGEFTVNIALCTHGEPVLGVIYVPVSGDLYYCVVETKKAFKTSIDGNHSLPSNLFIQNDRIQPGKIDSRIIRVVGSRSHMNVDTTDFIQSIEKEYDEVKVVSRGSSLKFCLVAEGKADVYPRFAPTMEWDTAAGHAICKAVGLKVLEKESMKELRYNKENLLNPHFIVTK